MDGKHFIALFRLCERLLPLSVLCGRNMFAQLHHTDSMYGQLGDPRMGRALTTMLNLECVH
jgi:hypothetical protein